MKKFKFLFVLLFSSFILQGQKYTPLLETGKTWNIFENWIYWGETHPHHLEICEIDTTRFIVIKEWHNQLQELGYLFEDTISQKVYYTDLYENEVVLYDFSLEEGDVFNYLMITVIDSIQLLDGNYRKRIVFEDGLYSWIEGIGSIEGGLLWSDWSMKKHIPEAWMLCYYENDSLLLMNENFEHFNTCDLSFTNIVEETSGQSVRPTISPNPFSEKVSLSFDSPLYGETFEVIIKTLDGRVIYTETVNSDIFIDLSFLSKGVYLLLLRNSNSQHATKIIKS